MNAHHSSEDMVLVVDDSPDTIAMLNDTLDQAGMTTLVALEGPQAIKIARKMLPDIILLDAMMPNMDGFEVCEKLKSDPELKAIPVIFMTGLSDSDSIVKGFNAGGVDYITKPINTAELVARVRVHLANARLTLSVQTALDVAGQYVFACNPLGDIVWTTPQVNQLLQNSGDASWLSSSLKQQLNAWLQRLPHVGSALTLNSPQNALKVELLGNKTAEEVLLRLIDTAQPDETARLKAALPLTGREAEVLRWIAAGKTNREIGQILGTSPRTVNKHLEQIFKKLGVENRTAAAAKALAFLGR